MAKPGLKTYDGPPLQYKSEMAEVARNELSKGKSISAACVALDIQRSTFYKYIERCPDFAEAVEKGKNASQAFWEERGTAGIFGEIDKFSATPWMFVMKNRFRDDYAEDKKDDGKNSVIEKLLEKL